MEVGITWKRDTFGISWAYEGERLVVSTVFEDKSEAASIAREVEGWNTRFTRITVVELDDVQYALCVYQDPQVARGGRTGLYREGVRGTGYEQAKPMILERPPLLQIAYAEDMLDMRTYEQVSSLVPLRKCRIISPRDLKRQEFFYEKGAVGARIP
ncbi:conserved hypothetical protein [Nitrosopumilaceae archaeon]|nr:hypothetical protein [Nitrosopumilus sp.]CAI9831327.1 conserved hypothetical protein [Nitrosopumilaceae archaeon]MDA7940933.1 hypothetical protein [Nitrosopumilus sp.]MDA7943211.1 hypothetical protein [Nitrosopumilus sp.]MDA7944296.1 hypothetical protein [Nitrosopumilus sp.]